MKTKNMTTPHLRKSIGRSPLRSGFLLTALALAWFALSPTARAVSPAPDGGYPGGNTAEGDGALFSLTTGLHNTAIGFHALYSETTGNGNTANGKEALYFNSTGDANTATGYSALSANTTGIENTANGVAALQQNTTGNHNTATGVHALLNNTTADENTANGYGALESNTTGFINTAIGNDALYSNTTGHRNTGVGSRALESNTTGFQNTATGRAALLSNTTGVANTADGLGALANNTTGSLNTAEGNSALFNNSTGTLNTALGFTAGDFTTGNNNIAIGNLGVAAESGTIRVGMQVAATDEFGNLHPAHTATYIAGINGSTIAKGVGVLVGADGRLGTKPSSQRFKDAIKPMDKASEAILALKPVTFRYKQELDPEGIPQFGLVAEEVEKVHPDLVSRDAKGEVYTVRYEAVNAMLLNEFLKDHRKVEEQDATISQLKKDFRATVAELNARLKDQDSKIEKVSAQIEVSKPAPQTVANNQ
jgi:hypothetical protein